MIIYKSKIEGIIISNISDPNLSIESLSAQLGTRKRHYGVISRNITISAQKK